MKNKILFISVFMMCTFASAQGFNSCEWVQYLGDPQRTGYSACNGPETPEVLWKVSMPGGFDTSPFIVDNKVLILWKNSHGFVEAKVLLLDLLTGKILQEFYDPQLSRVFPVDDRIIGGSGSYVYEIDLVSATRTLLTVTPKKGSLLYPVVLTEKIVFPATPVVCLSTSDFDVIWSLEDVMLDPELDLFNLAGDEDILAFIMQDQLYVIDSSTGVLKWTSEPLTLALWVVLGKDAIYCGGRNLWAFNRNGSEIWDFVPDERIVSNIVLGLDGLYFADEENTLYKIDMNGNLIWKTYWQVSPWYYKTHLIGAGDTLYCIGNYGKPDLVARTHVSAYNMEDGNMIWDLEFGSSCYIKGPPATAEGILVIGNTNGELIALASDPELYKKQGDAFLSENLKEEAISSYEKAAELYEKKGDLKKSQEIQEKIYELENPQETMPPTTPPETTLAPTSPPPPEISTLIPISVLVFASMVGIFFAYYFIKQRKP